VSIGGICGAADTFLTAKVSEEIIEKTEIQKCTKCKSSLYHLFCLLWKSL
jgi:predicted  nucleic acid-binding Zn-ribbon protein